GVRLEEGFGVAAGPQGAVHDDGMVRSAFCGHAKADEFHHAPPHDGNVTRVGRIVGGAGCHGHAPLGSSVCIELAACPVGRAPSFCWGLSWVDMNRALPARAWAWWWGSASTGHV